MWGKGLIIGAFFLLFIKTALAEKHFAVKGKEHQYHIQIEKDAITFSRSNKERKLRKQKCNKLLFKDLQTSFFSAIQGSKKTKTQTFNKHNASYLIKNLHTNETYFAPPYTDSHQFFKNLSIRWSSINLESNTLCR